ncbi:hypothetical protein H5410_034787 [Solanum commersonii]|uniref:Uncharacterized protein n=1 Tax=Solanum commersonii TaxID=4109 RepID=A0A9J5YSD4_SOLCO|nr:hypothetical protein H5410_034787 [Solanum commersonii]
MCSELMVWVGVRSDEVKVELERIKQKNRKQFKKEIVAAIWGASIYHTWRASKNCGIGGVCTNRESLMEESSGEETAEI